MPRPRRIALVVVSVLAVGPAAAGIALATRGHTRPPLVLVSTGTVVSDTALAPIGEPVPYQYRLTTPAPDLGSAAPVARLEGPSIDAARVVAMARALGLRGSATEPHPGWRVNDGAAQLTFTVEALPPGAYTCQGNNPVPFAVDLGVAIGNRRLVDGACHPGAEAATTSWCASGAVRWQPSSSG